MIYLDTHAVAWLYAGQLERFTERGLALLESEDILVSPMVQLELQCLREIGRLTVDSALIIETLGAAIGLRLCEQPFARVIAESILQTWTRDPFDRLIVAQAVSRGAPLLTKDETILGHCPLACW